MRLPLKIEKCNPMESPNELALINFQIDDNLNEEPVLGI